MSWSFTDNYGGLVTGSFAAIDNGVFPGPPQLDPANNKFLVDARGRAIHWRGYGVKHVENPPFTIYGGGTRQMYSPFPNDTLVLLRR